jgi:hypothetical protein
VTTEVGDLCLEVFLCWIAIRNKTGIIVYLQQRSF